MATNINPRPVSCFSYFPKLLDQTTKLARLQTARRPNSDQYGSSHDSLMAPLPRAAVGEELSRPMRNPHLCEIVDGTFHSLQPKDCRRDIEYNEAITISAFLSIF